jgi:hypothetical protein
MLIEFQLTKNITKIKVEKEKESIAEVAINNRPQSLFERKGSENKDICLGNLHPCKLSRPHNIAFQYAESSYLANNGPP